MMMHRLADLLNSKYLIIWHPPVWCQQL